MTVETATRKFALDLSSKARRQVGNLVQRNSALFADTTSDPKEV